jgi:hypothetical protein
VSSKYIRLIEYSPYFYLRLDNNIAPSNVVELFYFNSTVFTLTEALRSIRKANNSALKTK